MVIDADSTVVVHVNARGEAVEAQVAFGRKAIENAVRRLRQATLDGDSSRAAQLGNELQQAILPDAMIGHILNGDGEGTHRFAFYIANVRQRCYVSSRYPESC